MREGRKPAHGVRNLDGTHTISSTHETCGNNIAQNTSSQQTHFNFCDHFKHDPSFFDHKKTHKKRSVIVAELDKKLRLAYFHPKNLLRSLQRNLETDRQKHSQRREACIKLLEVMCYYQDDATGRIGRKMNDGTFRDYSLYQLAAWASLKIKRAYRAMRDIIKAGYMSVMKQYYKDEVTGEVIGFNSIRQLLPKLFTELDVTGKLWTSYFSSKRWKQEREAKSQSKQELKKSRAALGLIKEAMGAVINRGKRKMERVAGIVRGIPKPESNAAKEARIAHEKKLMQAALELFNLKPEKSLGEYLRLLRDKYPPPT